MGKSNGLRCSIQCTLPHLFEHNKLSMTASRPPHVFCLKVSVGIIRLWSHSDPPRARMLILVARLSRRVSFLGTAFVVDMRSPCKNQRPGLFFRGGLAGALFTRRSPPGPSGARRRSAAAARRLPPPPSAAAPPAPAPARLFPGRPPDIYAYRTVRKTSAKKRQAVKMAMIPDEIIMSMYILGGW